jgi:hypothetical protein
MPQAQEMRSFSFPGYSFNDQSAAVSFESPLAFTKALPALVAAQCDGELTGRTDDDTGIVTLSTGHGIETSDVVDVYWAGGVRYGMTATVSDNAVTVDGGSGDALPVLTTTITAVAEQIDWEINFDGDDAQIIGVLYRNPDDTGAKAHLDLQDSGPVTIEELDLVHETANGGLDHITNIAAGDTNIYSGNRIVAGKVTHDSQQAGTVYCCVGIVAP